MRLTQVSTGAGISTRRTARLDARERPGGVLAHERLRAVERTREHVGVICRADVAEHHGRVALQPPSFARFIGEPLNAALNSACVIPNSSRASVRASCRRAPRAADGESCGS